VILTTYKFAYVLIDWWEKVFGQLALKEITPALITETRDKLLHGDLTVRKEQLQL
jgi:hypothetical protein